MTSGWKVSKLRTREEAEASSPASSVIPSFDLQLPGSPRADCFIDVLRIVTLWIKQNGPLPVKDQTPLITRVPRSTAPLCFCSASWRLLTTLLSTQTHDSPLHLSRTLLPPWLGTLLLCVDHWVPSGTTCTASPPAKAAQVVLPSPSVRH